MHKPFFKGMIMMARCMPIYQEFRAEHPFLYYIVDKKSNTAIFSGRNTDLKKQ